MSPGSDTSAIRTIGRLYREGTLAGLSEGELLDRFASDGDEFAFEALVQRLGPMVLGLCRRILGDLDAADDAFQATFLVLAQRARSIRDGGRLIPWTYGVATRVARRARAKLRRQQTRERSAFDQEYPEIDFGAANLERGEVVEILDEEIDRLPEFQKQPIILCYFSGLTIDQAADRLQLPVGTVRSRLARGRDRLQDRLRRRGIEGSDLLASLLAPGGLDQVIPSLSLVRQTSTLICSASKIGAIGTVVSSATKISVLAHEATRGMLMTKVTALATGLIPVLTLTGSLTLTGFPTQEKPDVDSSTLSSSNTPSETISATEEELSPETAQALRSLLTVVNCRDCHTGPADLTQFASIHQFDPQTSTSIDASKLAEVAAHLVEVQGNQIDQLRGQLARLRETEQQTDSGSGDPTTAEIPDAPEPAPHADYPFPQLAHPHSDPPEAPLAPTPPRSFGTPTSGTVSPSPSNGRPRFMLEIGVTDHKQLLEILKSLEGFELPVVNIKGTSNSTYRATSPSVSLTPTAPLAPPRVADVPDSAQAPLRSTTNPGPVPPLAPLTPVPAGPLSAPVSPPAPMSGKLEAREEIEGRLERIEAVEEEVRRLRELLEKRNQEADLYSEVIGLLY